MKKEPQILRPSLHSSSLPQIQIREEAIFNEKHPSLFKILIYSSPTPHFSQCTPLNYSLWHIAGSCFPFISFFVWVCKIFVKIFVCPQLSTKIFLSALEHFLDSENTSIMKKAITIFSIIKLRSSMDNNHRKKIQIWLKLIPRIINLCEKSRLKTTSESQ